MFVILLSYKVEIEKIDEHLLAHRSFLDECYQKNYFIVSGMQNPRKGGVIISQVKDKSFLEELIKQDPFYIHDLADFEIIEFTPTKHHVDFPISKFGQ